MIPIIAAIWCLQVQGVNEIAPTCVQQDLTYAECMRVLKGEHYAKRVYRTYTIECATENFHESE